MLIQPRTSLFEHSRHWLAALLIFLLIASPAGAQTPEGAGALLEQTATTMADLESFEFTVTTPVGKTLLSDGIELGAIEGAILRPDRFNARVTISMPFLEFGLEAIGISSEIWVTDPMAGSGQFFHVNLSEAGSLPPLALLNPDALITAVLGALEDTSLAGEESIDDIETTIVTGTIDPGRLASVAPGPVDSMVTSLEPLGVTLWIDDDHRIVRAELDGPLMASEEGRGRIVRRIDLFAFDEPITIEPPESVSA
jgi:hypothetical protein